MIRAPDPTIAGDPQISNVRGQTGRFSSNVPDPADPAVTGPMPRPTSQVPGRVLPLIVRPRRVRRWQGHRTAGGPRIVS